MLVKIKDKRRPDPRIIERRRKAGLPPLPEIEEEGPEIVYPGKVFCPACQQMFAVSPYIRPEEGLALHQEECRRMKREIIVVRSRA